MTKKRTLKQVQAVRCPICGAGPGEKCELSTGQPRSEPHRNRLLKAEVGAARPSRGHRKSVDESEDRGEALA